MHATFYRPLLLPLLVIALCRVSAFQLAAYELPVPSIEAGTNAFTLSWQGTGTLMQSDTLTDTWSEVAGAVSPHLFEATGIDRMFFRIDYQTLNYVIVDTNQGEYYDGNGDVISPAPVVGEAYFGQDAAYADTPPDYTDNGDGTVTDNRTGLIWQQVPPAAFYSRPEAEAYADALVLGGQSDWRLPTIKELLSLADLNGSSRPEIDRPYIDDSVFTIYDPQAITTFVPSSASSTKRDIDGQFWSSTDYVGRTINNDSATFGYNFIDGRIKGYPNGVLSGPTGTAFVRCVRGNTSYGQNNFIDNGDGTITDLATGLMWLQEDSGQFPAAGTQGDGTLNWIEALDWAENLEYAGYDDWILPDAKQLQSIVDYTRAPDADDTQMQSAAIDPIFHMTDEESWFWTSSSLGDDLFEWGVYVCFGRALAIDQGTFLPTVNAHGAGAMRSDPKAGDPSVYATGHGPQNDLIRIYNYARPMRRCITPSDPSAAAIGDITLSLSGTSSAPSDLAVMPTSLTFGGVVVDPGSVSRPSQQQLSFDFDTSTLAPGDYSVVATYAAPYEVQSGTHTIHSSILLLIVDDWGVDASPLDNDEPGVFLPNLPNITALASEGLRFTRAYSHPTCSPMRASMLTGRQPWLTGVGHPDDEENFSPAEITLPEIFTTTGAPHDLISVGKWHLGGADNGYLDRGGWPEFYGITGGALTDYSSWPKNSNGSVATTTTYSTTDQVNEAKTFIDARVAAGTPWFAWVAFNAPHTPWHNPPSGLAPPGGYSSIGSGESTESHQYRMMLEALDTEIGRLLMSINPYQTNIILIGDNGTHQGLIQVPFSSAHAKGTLYNGGTQVPMVVKGPAVTVTAGSATDTLVHCIDVFSTVLDMAGIDEASVPGLASQNTTSTSIVPVLTGSDTAARCMVAEQLGDTPGRAIILDTYPDYKCIIHGDPDSPLDTPTIEFYNIGAPAYDVDEQAPLDIGALAGTALDAYQACLAKDAALGGGYSDPATGYDTLYIELPTSGVVPPVPNLLRPGGVTPIDVTSVTVDGSSANLSIVGRYHWGSSLADEGDDAEAQYWVKVRVAPANGGPYTTAHVVFPDTPDGVAREYDSVTIAVNP